MVTLLVTSRNVYPFESDWLNPDSNKPGTYVFPEDFRPKYGHFDMIFPSDVEVVRKDETKSHEVHAFPADRYLLRCAESAAHHVQLAAVKGEQRSGYVGCKPGT